MQTVTSHDGTTIAYDRCGEGPAVIIVGAALNHRKFKKLVQLADSLSASCTVINYDRRGRGDSGDVKPFAVDREIEDIAALIQSVGGHASLWGWSSGGALALRAAGAGIGVDRVAVYETPFIVGPHGSRPTPDYEQRLDELVAAGHRGGAVRHFMRNAIGIPAPFVTLMRLMPMWREMEDAALTLPYDWAALGDHNMHGAPLRPAEWASVTIPTLVAYGSKSPKSLQNGSHALRRVLPNAELKEFKGVGHNLKVSAISPALTAFFTRSDAIVGAVS